MKSSTTAWIVVAIIVIIGGWYWFAMSSSPSSTQSQNQPQQNIITLGENTASSTPFLTASNGMTLYTFDKDSVGTTTCYGACAQKWPPYVIAGDAQVKPPQGASGQVATIGRLDGGQQVTYQGMPLYFYSDDKQPGDSMGDNFNNLWHIVKP